MKDNIIVVHKQNLSESDKEQIYEILRESDNLFEPPLSVRTSLFQTDFSEVKEKKDLDEYLNQLIKENFLLAYDEQGNILGFLVFRHNRQLPYLMASCNYIIITIIRKRYRNRGIGSRLYRFIETSLPSYLRMPYIARRTTSTNLTQIHLYQKTGFNLIHTVFDDREPGVDTLYYAKLIDSRERVV